MIMMSESKIHRACHFHHIRVHKLVLCVKVLNCHKRMKEHEMNMNIVIQKTKISKMINIHNTFNSMIALTFSNIKSMANITNVKV